MRRAEKPTPRNSPPIRARCKQQGAVWTDGAWTHRTADSSPHPPSPNTASAPLGSDGSGAAIRPRLAALVSARGIPIYLPRVAGHGLRATFVYNSMGRRSPCSRPPRPPSTSTQTLSRFFHALSRPAQRQIYPHIAAISIPFLVVNLLLVGTATVSVIFYYFVQPLVEAC